MVHFLAQGALAGSLKNWVNILLLRGNHALSINALQLILTKTDPLDLELNLIYGNKTTLSVGRIL